MHELLRILDALVVHHPVYCAIGFIVCRSISVIVPPVPGLPMDLLASHLFGPKVGFLLAEAGIMLGATVAFAVGRAARNSGAIAASSRYFTILTQRIHWGLDSASEEKQIAFWLIVRLLTNPLFDPISYAGGLTRGAYRPFFLGTWLGNMPSIWVFFDIEAHACAISPIAVVGTALSYGMVIWYIASRWLAGFEIGDKN